MATSPTMIALELLKAGERRAAAEQLRLELARGPESGEKWKSVGRLAAHIGEIDMAIEAARRFSETQPKTLNRIVRYVGELATFGRADEGMSVLDQLSGEVAGHPAVLHVKATLLAERGQKSNAIALFREAIARSPGYSESWFPLAMSTNFSEKLDDLENLEKETARALEMPPSIAAQHFYALGKAYRDLGDDDRSFANYDRGARLRRGEERYDRLGMESMARRIIKDFTPDSIASLEPSEAPNPRAIFVNGVPRSGSTLVEQILVSHSAVDDGGEVNLVRPALIPTLNNSLAGARAMEARAGTSNPWTAIAADYDSMLVQRFRTDKRVVDKTLNQSFLMGLLLHSMPGARIVWLRRRPADTALSCYQTCFATPVAWSWSLDDIGHFFSLDNMLFEHWLKVFPDRIFVVPYEELVSDPSRWVRQIANHVGLRFEAQMLDFHQSDRPVRTASTQQIRAPISTARVGSADRFAERLAPFWAQYGG